MNRIQHYERLMALAPDAGSTWCVPNLSKNRPFRAWCNERKDRTLKTMDAGCGLGYFSKALSSYLKKQYNITCQSYGLDLMSSENNVFDQIPGGFKFKEQDFDGKKLEAEDEYFDLVICNHVIEHIFETEFLARELRRILRPDGICIISTPDLACWINRLLLLLFGIQPFSTEVGTESMEYGWPIFRAKLKKWAPPGHIRCFTGKALKDMAEKCGFCVKGTWKQENKLLYRNVALILSKNT